MPFRGANILILIPIGATPSNGELGPASPESYGILSRIDLLSCRIFAVSRPVTRRPSA